MQSQAYTWLCKIWLKYNFLLQTCRIVLSPEHLIPQTPRSRLASFRWRLGAAGLREAVCDLLTGEALREGCELSSLSLVLKQGRGAAEAFLWQTPAYYPVSEQNASGSKAILRRWCVWASCASSPGGPWLSACQRHARAHLPARTRGTRSRDVSPGCCCAHGHAGLRMTSVGWLGQGSPSSQCARQLCSLTLKQQLLVEVHLYTFGLPVC